MGWKKFVGKCAATSAVAVVLIGCSSKPTPETKAAISELKGLNSKLDVGINLIKYSDALRSAKVAVDRAIESDPKSENNQVIENVMSMHISALELWRCKTESNRYDSYAQDKCRNQAYETLIFPLSPELKSKVEPHKKTLFSFSSSKHYYGVNHDKVLQMLWGLTEIKLDSLESE